MHVTRIVSSIQRMDSTPKKLLDEQSIKPAKHTDINTSRHMTERQGTRATNYSGRMLLDIEAYLVVRLLREVHQRSRGV